MQRIELNEVETMLLEQRFDAENVEVRKLSRIRARLMRLQEQQAMKSANVFAILAKAHGVKAPEMRPRYSQAPNGHAVLEWEEPRAAEKAPAPSPVAPAETPIEAKPVEAIAADPLPVKVTEG